MRRKMIQILEAPGWYAVYRQPDGAADRAPLVAWALVRDQEEHDTRVVGLVATERLVEYADLRDNFKGYVHVSDGSGKEAAREGRDV